MNASSGTIAQPSLSMFHASMMHEFPPCSYIHTLKALLPDSKVSSPDIIHEQPWSFQLPHSLSPICIVPPSSVASINSMVSCSGMSIKPAM